MNESFVVVLMLMGVIGYVLYVEDSKRHVLFENNNDIEGCSEFSSECEEDTMESHYIFSLPLCP